MCVTHHSETISRELIIISTWNVWKILNYTESYIYNFNMCDKLYRELYFNVNMCDKLYRELYL